MRFQSCIYFLSALVAVAESRVVYITVTEGQSDSGPTNIVGGGLPSSTRSPGSTPSSTGSPGGTGGSSGQRGIAYNSTSPSLAQLAGHSVIGWAWDWSPDPNQGPGAPSGLTYVPTLTEGQTGSWSNQIANYDTLLGQNEPDYAGQQPGDAATFWSQYMNREITGTKRLGSPGVTNSLQNGWGLPWLQKFVGTADPKPDFWVTHWYGCTPGPDCTVDSDLSLFKSQMDAFVSAAGGADVWLTEFQHYGSMSDQQSFLSQAITYLEGKNEIKKYAYFMATEGQLLNSDGSLTDLGNTYVGGS